MKGFTFLIQFGLAILATYQNQILSMDIDEVGYYLKLQLKEMSEIDVRHLIYKIIP